MWKILAKYITVTSLCNCRAYWGFADHFKEEADKLLNSLDPSYKKMLQGEMGMSNSSSSQSLQGSQSKQGRRWSMVTIDSRISVLGHVVFFWPGGIVHIWVKEVKEESRIIYSWPYGINGASKTYKRGVGISTLQLGMHLSFICVCIDVCICVNERLNL